VGFRPIQHKQMVLSYIRQHWQIEQAELIDLYRLTEGQAEELLRRLVFAKQIELRGAGRTSAYVEFIDPAQT
jgi:ATP-dependent DNA helicase RecG